MDIFLQAGSFANTHDFIHRHLDFSMYLDFQSKTVLSTTTYDFEVVKFSSRLRLDVIDIDILEVLLNGNSLSWRVVKQSKYANSLGDYLQIDIPKSQENEKKLQLVIKSKTLSVQRMSAINWLQPAQTLGKKNKYMFTQCQPIYCRSIFPCQDKIQAKFTFNAKISNSLDLPTYISAIHTSTEPSNPRNFVFEQKLPISSYLFSIVSGNLDRKQISQRIAVITEPQAIDSAYKEFIDSQKYLQTLQKILYPFPWGQYNIVLLPPSFPYGGMENPNLTFLSPSVVTGSIANINVLVHEMCHSWTGNLVSCKDWKCFWLNEGFTNFVQFVSFRKMFGQQSFDVLTYMQYTQLVKAVDRFKDTPGYTKLQTQALEQTNPDDYYSIIAYDKGAFFLLHLQAIFGQESLLGLFRGFLKKHEGRCVTSQMFREQVQNFAGDKKDKVRWDQWVNAAGLKPQSYSIPACKIIKEQVQNFMGRILKEDSLLIGGADCSDPSKVMLKHAILNQISSKVGIQHKQYAEKIQNTYKLSEKFVTAEQRATWLQVCLTAGFDVFQKTASMLSTIGRMKYVRPLYRALAKFDLIKTHKLFKELQSSYHQIAQIMVRKDIGL